MSPVNFKKCHIAYLCHLFMPMSHVKFNKIAMSEVTRKVLSHSNLRIDNGDFRVNSLIRHILDNDTSNET